ncbi:MAG: PKD domain-containing protein, partial [Candidatus Thermoplasmatota archaeon]
MSRTPKLFANLLAASFILPMLFIGLSATPVAAAAASPTFGAAGDARFDDYQPGPTMGNSAGEPGIGVNWNTGKAFINSNNKQLRVTFNDSVFPPSAFWEDKTSPFSIINIDPLLFTDSVTGRTFAGGLDGACSILSYTDDDGDTWVPMPAACDVGGWDHETVGGGPYAAPLNAIEDAPDPIYKHAVYYCSQVGVEPSPAFCSRSLDGGLTFEEMRPTWLMDCWGISGHIRVAPDGTIYVPSRNCGGKTGFGASPDNALNWAVRTPPGSLGSGRFDPSIAPSYGADASGNYWAYFGQAESNGAYIAVSKDRGASFEDLGAGNGVTPTKWLNVGALTNPPVLRAEFAEVIAGDHDRAAFAFLGSTDGAVNVGGCAPAQNSLVWKMYVAMTYDGGVTWSVQKASDNIVQRGSIGNPDDACRNLLDFNDITVDEEGRVLIGYADGCTSTACEGASGTSGQSRSAKATITRQSTGKGLFAEFDEGGSGSTLNVDAGGPYSGAVNSPVTLRGTASGGTGTYNYTWTFTDGTDDQYGRNVTLSWSTAGDHVATLRVTDGVDTKTDTATVHVYSGSGPAVVITSPSNGATIVPGPTTVSGTVDRAGGGANGAPVATISASPPSGAAPLSVTFTLGATDSDGTVVSWSLNYGDGSAPDSGTGVPPASKTHSYASGFWTATLTVTDDLGTTGTATATVTATLPTGGGVLWLVGDGATYVTDFSAGGTTDKTFTMSAVKPAPSETRYTAVGSANYDQSKNALVATWESAEAVTLKGGAGDTVSLVIDADYTQPLNAAGNLCPLGARLYGEDGSFLTDIVKPFATFSPNAMTKLVVPLTPTSSYTGKIIVQIGGNGVDCGSFPVTFAWGTDAFNGRLVLGPQDQGGGTGPGASFVLDSVGDATSGASDIVKAHAENYLSSSRYVLELAQPARSNVGSGTIAYAMKTGGVELAATTLSPDVVNVATGQPVEGAKAYASGSTFTFVLPASVRDALLPHCPCPLSARSALVMGDGVTILDQAPDVMYASATVPLTDDEGDNTAVPGTDLKKVIVSDETASSFKVTLFVNDLASSPPSTVNVVGIPLGTALDFTTGFTYHESPTNPVKYQVLAERYVLSMPTPPGVETDVFRLQVLAAGTVNWVTNVDEISGVWDTASNTISWTVPKALMVVKTAPTSTADAGVMTGGRTPARGDILTDWTAEARSWFFAGAGAGPGATVWDTATGDGSYTMTGGSNSPPTSTLSADLTSGSAPLGVTFTLGATDDG